MFVCSPRIKELFIAEVKTDSLESHDDTLRHRQRANVEHSAHQHTGALLRAHDNTRDTRMPLF